MKITKVNHAHGRTYTIEITRADLVSAKMDDFTRSQISTPSGRKSETLYKLYLIADALEQEGK